MPTHLQLRLIHVAAREAGITEEGYRMVLRTVGGVNSSAKLTQADYEDCMAVFEDSGFRHPGKPSNYWRMKVVTRGGVCNARMVFKIRELAAKQKYALDGLCHRFSDGNTSQVEKLTPRQALSLINMLQAVVDRENLKRQEEIYGITVHDSTRKASTHKGSELATGSLVEACVEAGMTSESSLVTESV
jgi:hypothetical protein